MLASPETLSPHLRLFRRVYIKTLSANQTNEIIVRDAHNKQPPTNQFLVLR